MRARLAILALAAPLAWGLDPSLALTQLHKRYWQVEDGLPGNYVATILRAPDGYLLLGTDEGLARFDGVRSTPFDPDPALHLARRWTLSLARSRDGSLWTGTFDGSLYHTRAGRTLHRFESRSSVFALLEDRAGALWASTRAGVLRFSQNRFEPIPHLPRPPETGWNVLSEDPAGALWVVSIDGLHVFQHGAARLVVPNGGAHGDLLSVMADPAGNLWLGSSRGLFRLLPNRTLQPIPHVPGPVVSIVLDRDQVLWAGTWGHGIRRIRQPLTRPLVDPWTSTDGLPDDFVRTLSEDPDGTLWVATRSGGLGRWKEPLLVPYGHLEGLAGNFATTVVPGPAGDLWLGTWRGGLYHLLNGRLAPQPTPSETLFTSIRALAIDPAGHPWIGNWEGLFSFDGARYTHHSSPLLHYVSALHFDRRGRLWVGTNDQGLLLFPSGSPKDEPQRLLPGHEIVSLVEDPAGRLWAATPTSVHFFDPQPHAVAGLPAEPLTSLSLDAQARVWATTGAGSLVLLSANPIRILARREGLPAHPLYRLVDDARGSLWLSSPKGILRLLTAQVDDLLAGRRPRLEPLLYGQDDGMRTVECHRLSQPAGARSPDGNVWFPTARGFVEIRTARLQPQLPPPVYLEEITVDNRPLDGPVLLEPGRQNLEFHFTALALAAPSRLQFRYRLEGYDNDWIEAGRDRVAHYNRLPPGRFRLLVAARDGAGPWSTAPASLQVEQLPRFTETRLFLFCCLLAAAAALYGLFRWRVHLVKGRYALVLAERNRIAREWHDTLLAGFSALTWQLEATLSNPARLPETLPLALKMVAHYRAEARGIIWDLRDNRSPGETLPVLLRAALDRTAASSSIPIALEVNGTPRKLPDDLERNVIRICQEAAANALHHAAPTHVSVTLAYAPNTLTARIADDGAGFDSSSSHGLVSGHFGLAVMRERAERFNGTLTLDSAPGRGTIVIAVLPTAPMS